MESAQIKSQTQSKKWLLAEKVIGFLLFLWSAFILYNVLTVISNMYNSGFAGANKISFGAVAAKNHLAVICSTLCIFGSVMLLYKDKTGWFFCVVSSFYFAIALFISSRTNSGDNTLHFAKFYKSYGLVSLLFVAIFIFLLSKPVRVRYMPTTKTLLWLVIILGVTILDILIF